MNPSLDVCGPHRLHIYTHPHSPFLPFVLTNQKTLDRPGDTSLTAMKMARRYARWEPRAVLIQGGQQDSRPRVSLSFSLSLLAYTYLKRARAQSDRMCMNVYMYIYTHTHKHTHTHTHTRCRWQRQQPLFIPLLHIILKSFSFQRPTHLKLSSLTRRARAQGRESARAREREGERARERES